MKVSKRGLAFILAEEAIVLNAYRDSVGVLTIGAGHTSMAGPPKVTESSRLSLVEALGLFQTDIAKYEAGVSRAIKVPLTQNEFDALVSFHYNTGAISTGSVDDKINRGDRAAAMDTLLQYKKGGPGLEDRRKRERAMFERGEYFGRAIPVYDHFPGKPKAVSVSSLPWPDLYVPPPPDVEPPEKPAEADSSIPAPPGPDMPLTPLAGLAVLLACLAFVTAIIVFKLVN